MLVAVTGSSGFLGHAVVAALRGAGIEVREVVRKASTAAQCEVGPIDGQTNWDRVLAGVTHVVHCAGRAHVLDESAADPEAEFMRVNAHATGRLARAARELGIDRVVYVSSIGVLGRNTNGRPGFSNDDVPAPYDGYTRSKWRGEEALRQELEDSATSFVIVRPPLIYGPGAPANFERLLRLSRSGFPLPLGGVENRRSFSSLRNVVDLIQHCLTDARAYNLTFVVADRQVVSTADLLRMIAAADNRRARLVTVPVSLLRLVGSILGRARDVERVVDSLEVDVAGTCDILGWDPPEDIETGMRNALLAP